MGAYVSHRFQAIESVPKGLSSEPTDARKVSAPVKVSPEDAPFDTEQFRRTSGDADLMRELISISQEDVPPLLARIK